MKKLTILLLILMIIYISAYEQHDFTVQIERANVESFDRNYFENAQYYVSRFNKTTRGLNIRLNFKLQINRARIIGEIYKFLSNEYRRYPITLSYNFCQYLKNDTFGLRDMLTYGNFTDCPIKKGSYHVTNWVLDSTKFPPNLFYGQYLMEFIHIHGSTEILRVRLYISLNEIVKMKKRWN